MICLSRSTGEYPVAYTLEPDPYLRKGYEVHGKVGVFVLVLALYAGKYSLETFFSLSVQFGNRK